jgi:anti-anti-sigma factor
MGIALKQGKKSSVIGLDGAVDIASAAELKRILLEALAAGREVRVALDGVADLDVTVVQLLWAARRQAEVAGVKFALTERLPEQAVATLAHAGLDQFLTTVKGSQASGVKTCLA